MPEKLSQPPEDQPGKIIREIRVESLDDYLNPTPEYSDEEIAEMEQDMKRSHEEYVRKHGEKEEEKTLPYEPFDAGRELADITKLPKKDRPHKLEEFSEKMMAQKMGVAQTINELWKTIESDPDVSREDLLSKIKKASSDYKLTEYHIYCFEFAVGEYEKKHAAVEKYRVLYPDDAELFQACFGRKPVDKVEVRKGPMTLMFSCFDKDDYAAAYNHDRTADSKKPGTSIDEDRMRAWNTGGAAMGEVLIEELTGVVIIENAANHVEWKKVEKKVVKELSRGDSYSCDTNSQVTGEDVLQIEGAGSWKLKLLDPEYATTGSLERVQLVCNTEPDKRPIFDLVTTQVALENGRFAGVLRDIYDSKKTNYGNYIGNLEVNGKSYGYVEFNVMGGVKVTNNSEQTLIVRHTEYENVKTLNKAVSEETEKHEEQHQFDRLFSPIGNRWNFIDVMRGAVERTKDPEKAIDYVIAGLVKWERARIMDSRARDEIMSFFKDGRKPADILRIIRDSELYDYVNQDYTKHQIKLITKTIKDRIKNEMIEIFHDENGWGDLGVNALEVDEQRIGPYIARIFGEEYKADLKKWTDSVSVLEKKGYARDEIISLLYQEPVNSWPNLVRRTKPKV